MRTTIVTIDGKRVESSNQIGDIELTVENPLGDQLLVYDEDSAELVWRNTRNIFGGADSTTAVFTDVLGGATAATTSFRAILHGGTAKTF